MMTANTEENMHVVMMMWGKKLELYWFIDYLFKVCSNNLLYLMLLHKTEIVSGEMLLKFSSWLPIH